VEKWVYGGEGLSRVDGRVALTPFVLPGEKVRIELGEGVNARLIEVLEPSPDRVEPPCPLFARCGGCHYQHAPYEFQLARKAEILREQLRRVGKIEYSGAIETISGPPLGYRNRVQVHILSSGRAGRRLGYLARRSHKLVPLTGDCPVASPRLNQELAAMRERLHDARFPRFVRALELFTNETDVQVNVVETAQPLRRDFFDWCKSVNILEYPTVFGTFHVGPKSFFQVNRFLADKLVEAALSGSEGSAAMSDSEGNTAMSRSEGKSAMSGSEGNTAMSRSEGNTAMSRSEGNSAMSGSEGNTAMSGSEGNSALDLYAGVGLFAIPMSRRFASVTAVEAGSSAVRDLEANAAGGLRVEHSRVEDYIARLDTTPDFVLADPPRAGLGKEVVAHLNRLAPPRLTIVSCDPATLARDLAALQGYGIDHLTLVDLFPQTYHIETVAHLRLN
jgi:23S rRNA (uracil1939-C5)-methyltransferase